MTNRISHPLNRDRGDDTVRAEALHFAGASAVPRLPKAPGSGDPPDAGFRAPFPCGRVGTHTRGRDRRTPRFLNPVALARRPE
jgi:hypothetical protein